MKSLKIFLLLAVFSAALFVAPFAWAGLSDDPDPTNYCPDDPVDGGGSEYIMRRYCLKEAE